jgi:hypothetical protein
LIYIDDILVFGKTIEEHNKNLSLVLQRLERYNLQENIVKRIMCVEKIKFLGYEISYNKVKPLLKRSQGIINYKEPKTKKELKDSSE